MGFNKAQNEAIMHGKGSCQVLAGPGSGKTLTIVNRIKYLIERYEVRPEEILVVYFYPFCGGRDEIQTLHLMGNQCSGYCRNVSWHLLRHFKVGIQAWTG